MWSETRYWCAPWYVPWYVDTPTCSDAESIWADKSCQPQLFVGERVWNKAMSWSLFQPPRIYFRAVGEKCQETFRCRVQKRDHKTNPKKRTTSFITTKDHLYGHTGNRSLERQRNTVMVVAALNRSIKLLSISQSWNQNWMLQSIKSNLRRPWDIDKHDRNIILCRHLNCR